MTENPVITLTYGTAKRPVPEVNIDEVLRYAGMRKGTDSESDTALMEMLRECIEEAKGRLSMKVCYMTFPVAEMSDEMLDIGFAKTDSASLVRHLEGCESIVLFGATVGLEIDRLIARYGRISPVKSLFFQAIGAERIEALCDAFNEDMRREQEAFGRSLKSRFSPGYGDVPLAMQRDIFASLDCARKIGLTLNESMLMSPSKSVTALIGIEG